MKLFSRDYNALLPEEEKRFAQIKRRERIKGSIGRKNLFRKYPRAARHNQQLFPNNYLDVVELKDEEKLRQKLGKFRRLLENRKCTERDVLRFIKTNKAYFIVGSILKRYQFGHHGAFLFPEFPLGNSHVADYLLVGDSSGGYEFLFVELEDPVRKSVMAKGAFGKTCRKGLEQIGDWKSWLDSHYSSLREVFKSAKKPGTALPDAFIDYDSSRMHFAVISGARKDYSEKTYRLRRDKHKNDGVLVLHYDNLVDDAAAIIGAETY